MFKKTVIKLSLATSLVLSSVNGLEFNQSQQEILPAVQQLIEKSYDIQKPPMVSTASDQADIFLEKMGIGSGWLESKKAYITIGVSEFSTNNPAEDKSFASKRDMKSMVSILNAKADIIAYIQTKMSTEDKVDIPGTDINKKFAEEKNDLINELNEQAKKIELYKRYLDKKELAMLEGATYSDYSKEFIGALITKLDEKFDSQIIEDRKRKEYQEAKNRYFKANDNIKVLNTRVKNITENTTEKISSKVQAISKLPLFGITALAQFESYNKDDGLFQIATVVIWSAKMEEASRAIIQGIDYRIPTKQTKTIQQWIRGEDWSSATGIRKFVDKDGITHFIGISAQPIRGKSSTARRKAKGVAELFAKKNAAISIFADIESSKQAEAVMETYSDGEDYEESKAMESFESHLKQGFKNRQINGASKRFSKVLIHPITQQKIHVAIYSIDQQGASRALMLQEKTYLTKILDIKSQNRLKGRSDGLKEKVRDEKINKEDYYTQKAKTKNDISNQVEKKNYSSSKIESTSNSVNNNYGNKEQNNYQPKTQVVQGGGTSDNFDW
jgi:hypothetical protein